MSHELYNRNDMTYVGETPWHGLGEKVSELLNLPNCLDWQTLKLPMSYNFQGKTIESIAQGLVRSDTGALLGVASKQYQAHQNIDLWRTFKQFALDGNMTLETAGALKGGKFVWALARINESFDVAGDKHNLYALMASGHDTSAATIFQPTAVRVVCNNTLTMALGSTSVRQSQSHKSQFDAIKAAGFVSTSILGFKAYEDKVIDMKAASLNGSSRAISEAFVAELLAPQILEKAIEATGFTSYGSNKRSFLDNIIFRDESQKLFVESMEKDLNRPLKLALNDTKKEMSGMAGSTAFGLLNGITRYIDHTHGRNADNRLANAWFGQGDTLKSKALDLAIEYTQALTS